MDGQTMQGDAQQYLVKETVASTICNAVLNLAAAYAIFHKRSLVPVGGATGLVRDLIGETFLAVALSSLVPSLIARHRRKAGTLPVSGARGFRKTGNPYLTAMLMGFIATCILIPPCAWLLPRMFPGGVSLKNVVLFKTVYGTVLGGLATFITLRSALRINE